ncbi:hypothetical protein [Cohnella lupini]|uniref:Uncharacterized protein n=1 Tax=Cohnella lupini TaxID=1294267 RepID=A0A3D9INU4_9BACL|nr:hypothetical protein [Cohnella lupini]RED63308.1 hypothetical protein DFP95_104303 [Cohnella lupini]
MKLLAYFTRALLTLATLASLLLLAVAFLFNDTGEPANRLLAIWGVYPLIGIILLIVNEILLRRTFASRSFWKVYGVFWACVAGAGGCAWAIYVFI